MIRRLWEKYKTVAAVVGLVVAIDYSTFRLIDTAQMNRIGASTQYHHPVIATGTKEGNETILHVGEELYVLMWIVRHEVNGTCDFAVKRYAEHVDGSLRGHRLLISTAILHFEGKNDLARVRWPIELNPYYVGGAILIEKPSDPLYVEYPYQFNKDTQQYERIWPFTAQPAMDLPLLPPGVDEQRFKFYVVGRYFCNVLDYVFPRYIQGGDRPDTTPPVYATVRRSKKQ
jgi:hypothetical protein